MSIELLNHNNLGSLTEILYLLKNVLSDEPMPLMDIKKYCSDRSIDFNYSIDGIISLLEFIGILYISDGAAKRLFNLDKTLRGKNHETCFREKLVHRLFLRLRETSQLGSFFPLDKIKYDTVVNAITIHNSSISMKYSGLKNFLINIDFLSPSTILSNVLIVDSVFEPFMEDKVVPWLIENAQDEIRSGKKLSSIQFQELQKLKEEYGSDAEEYVLNYERRRLSGHRNIDSTKIISKLDIFAGYDIVSFETLESTNLDRFIEVKSFSKTLEFFWSKNEVEVSKMKGMRYYLYLVDRDAIDNPYYEPIIVQNPYIKIYIHPDWRKDAQNWLIKYNRFQRGDSSAIC